MDTYPYQLPNPRPARIRWLHDCLEHRQDELAAAETRLRAAEERAREHSQVVTFKDHGRPRTRRMTDFDALVKLRTADREVMGLRWSIARIEDEIVQAEGCDRAPQLDR